MYQYVSKKNNRLIMLLIIERSLYYRTEWYAITRWGVSYWDSSRSHYTYYCHHANNIVGLVVPRGLQTPHGAHVSGHFQLTLVISTSAQHAVLRLQCLSLTIHLYTQWRTPNKWNSTVRVLPPVIRMSTGRKSGFMWIIHTTAVTAEINL